MPRRARVIVPETAHHVIQRGNYQQYIFEKVEDYRTYLYLIHKYSCKFAVTTHAYCIMGNHVHFIVSPKEHNGLAELFQMVNMRFSQYKNIEKQRQGHLWQGRFYSCVLGRTHLLRAIRYVEMNPVRARMVKKPWDYLWSSTRQHIRMEQSPILKTDFNQICRDVGLNHNNWQGYLLDSDEEMIQEMRSKTPKGLAIGEEDFILTLEKKLGVVLRALKAGRPRRKIGEMRVCP